MVVTHKNYISDQTHSRKSRAIVAIFSTTSFFSGVRIDFILFKKLPVPGTYCLCELDYCIAWHTERIRHLDKSMTLLSVTHVEGLCLFNERPMVVNRSYSWLACKQMAPYECSRHRLQISIMGNVSSSEGLMSGHDTRPRLKTLG
jgi:hypothetical protein